MATLKIRHFVSRPGRHGRRRYFWSPAAALVAEGWRMERLPDDEGRAIARAQELNEQLDRWRLGLAAPHAPDRIKGFERGTLGALIAQYRASPELDKLSKTTRRGYLWCCGILEEWGGTVPLAAITPKRCKVLHQDQSAPKKDPVTGKLLPPTFAKANAVLRVLRVLFKFAISEDLAFANPALDGVTLHDHAAKGRIWSRAAIDAFVAAADELGWHSVGTLVALNEWMAQRQADMLTLSKDAWTGRALITQGKTGARVELPIGKVPHLVVRIRDELARQVERKVTSTKYLVLCETTGQEWQADHFRHTFAEIRAAAVAKGCSELTGLVFMYLRHTGITRLADAGVETKRIADVSGHSERSCLEIIDRYRVRGAQGAEAAFQQRMDHEAKA